MKKRILCISIIFLNLLFIIGTTIIVNKFYNNVYRISIFTTIGIIATVLGGCCLVNSNPRFRFINKTQRTLIAISCMFTVFSYAMFFAFLPTYTVQDAYSVITADPRYISANVTQREAVCITDKHGNPFAGYGYTFDCEINGNSKGKIYFNPISGLYQSTGMP